MYKKVVTMGASRQHLPTLGRSLSPREGAWSDPHAWEMRGGGGSISQVQGKTIAASDSVQPHTLAFYRAIPH